MLSRKPVAVVAAPELAAEYLDALLQAGDKAAVLLALQSMTKAFGGVSAIAGRAQLNAKSLYRALSAHGNPELKTLTAILKAMGLRLSVKPLTDAQAGLEEHQTAGCSTACTAGVDQPLATPQR